MRFAASWGEATLRSIRDVAPTIRVLDLVPQPGPALPFTPGAHVDIGVMIDGQPETRSYSLIGEAGGDSYRIGVKRRADSRGGSDYLWSLAPGARLAITAPKTAFALDFDHSEFLLVAGGIGITPLIGMAGLLKRRGARVRLLHAARRRADLGFEAELASLLGADYRPMVSEESQRIDLGAEFARLAPDALCALCGPMPMLDEARRAWAAAGRKPANLRWETFGSSGRLGAEDFRVRVPRHGVDLVVPRTMTLLDALTRAGIGVISDCRRGECGLCAMDILAVEGEVDHRDVFFSDHEKAGNARICACVSRASGTLTLDSDYRPDAI